MHHSPEQSPGPPRLDADGKGDRGWSSQEVVRGLQYQASLRAMLLAPGTPPLELPAFQRIRTQEYTDEACAVTFTDRRVVDAASIQNLGEELDALVQAGRHKVVLDFSGVEFFSSAAFNKLIILQRRMRAHGGLLVLCSVPPALYETFRKLTLDQLFHIVETREEALAALRASGTTEGGTGSDRTDQ